MVQALLAFALAILVVCLGPLVTSPASAQQPASPRHIGILLVAYSPEDKQPQELRRGLRDAGYTEGRDVVIEWRSADGDYDQLPRLAADLVQRKLDVIVADTTIAVLTVKRATSTIPIVMALAADPVGSGLVDNLARPGANVTGLSLMTADLSDKRLQLLKEVLPRLSRVAVLWNPGTPFHATAVQDLKDAAPALSTELTFVAVRRPEQFGHAFLAVSRAHAEALYVLDDPLFMTHRATLLERTSKVRIPAIYGQREFTDQGGLISYGTNFGDMFRRSAGYVDKILKGAKPGDLPIEQPTKFELVVNLKTAQALGITIPESILVRADEVIR